MSRYVAFDVHQPVVVIELPACHGGDHLAVGQPGGFVHDVTVFRFLDQGASRQSDVPMGNVLRRCPDVGETFQCRRAYSRRCD